MVKDKRKLLMNPSKLKKKVYLDVRKIAIFGSGQPIISLDKDWCVANGWGTGDKVIVRLENLRGVKSLKTRR